MNHSILIKTVRIHGFRGLKNIEVDLEKTTVLTGMNNAGKTSFLKALQLSLGNRQFLSQDDFHIDGNDVYNKIIIDILIIPVDEEGKQIKDFSEEWSEVFTESKIRFYNNDFMCIPLRTIVSSDSITNIIKTKQYILETWVDFTFGEEPKKNWYELDYKNNITFKFDEIAFFYMDAKRDILEDIKLKNSYIGKMLSNIEYSPDDIKKIEEKIEELNQTAVEKSDILTIVKESLLELNSAMSSQSGGVELTPFTKKIRDLNKGLNINYGDGSDSFLMEYHGMGTRSWSSLLTLKAFIELFKRNSEKNEKVFFPIVALEEPEAHLHPNAQKTLYSQINSIAGQKIISTHSPYVASMAQLNEIQNFYKKNNNVAIGKLNIKSFNDEEIRKIKRQVINTRGEIFFSKCIVLFEGETEEQALPIFFEKYFGRSHIEYGVDFIGVSGHGNYLPFIRFAENLQIPWFILSDNDKDGTVKKSVEKQFIDIQSEKKQNECVIFLDDTFDFEKQLINDGFQDEIKEYLIESKIYANSNHEEAQKPKDIEEINNYSNDELYDVITKIKAQYAPLIAEKIINSKKDLSPNIKLLFDKLDEKLKIRSSI